MSTAFPASNGVEQEGSYPPCLFNAYLNDLVSNLKENGLGCHMNSQFLETFIYADNITT